MFNFQVEEARWGKFYIVISWIALPELHWIRCSRKDSSQAKCTCWKTWWDLGQGKWLGITLGSFQIGEEDSSLETSDSRQDHSTVHSTLSQKNQGQLRAAQGATGMKAFYWQAELPLTPVMRFHPFARHHPLVTPTLCFWWEYRKSTCSQSNFHVLSIWPMHWALIWVNESFSCRTSTENMHRLCLRGGICLQ